MNYFAYLDPGTGSVIIQAVVGAVLAVSVIFRGVIGRTIARLRTLLGRRKNKQTAGDEQES